MVVHVRVPKQYDAKKYRDAIAMGLFDLSVGIRPAPEEVAKEDTKTVRILLSEKGQQMWEELLPVFDNNKARLAREALCLVSKEPDHYLQCRI